MFYLITQYTYICVNITEVSGKDLYSNYMQSILIFSILFFLFFKAGGDLCHWFHDLLMFENLTLHARTSQALMLVYDHLMHHAACFLWDPLWPLPMATIPLLEHYLHPDSPQITFWDPAASETTGLCKGYLSLSTNIILSPFPNPACIFCWWMVLPSTHLPREKHRRHPKWIHLSSLCSTLSIIRDPSSPFDCHCFSLDLPHLHCR